MFSCAEKTGRKKKSVSEQLLNSVNKYLCEM